MSKVFSLVTLLTTIPAIMDVTPQHESDWQPDPDVKFYGVTVVNAKDTPLIKGVTNILTCLPARNDMVVMDNLITDAVGRNDVKQELSSRGFICADVDELKDAIRRFNTLANGIVNPAVSNWINSPEFGKYAAHLFEEPTALSRCNAGLKSLLGG